MRAIAILIVSAVVWIAGAAAVAAEATGEEVLFGLLIDRERAGNGLAPLSFDEELLVVARTHSGKMAAAGSVFHNPNLPNQVSGWSVLGENVGRGNAVEVIHDAFMKSPTHRAEILYSDYRGFAVGTVVSGGEIWVTELFVARSETVVAGERHLPPSNQRRPAIPVPHPVSKAIRPQGIAMPESLHFTPERSGSLGLAALALLAICLDGYLLRLTKRRVS